MAESEVVESETETYILFNAISLTLQIFSIVFNGAIICTLWKKSLLQYPSNRFVFSLCLCHLLVSALSISISIISPIFPHASAVDSSQNNDLKPTGATCSHNENALASQIMLYVTFAVAIGTSITVALISVERYVTIARPMKYKSIVTPRRCLAVIVLCWLLSLFITTLPMIIFDKQTKLCGSFAIPTANLGIYFATVFAVVTFLALSVMILCYSHIFTIAKEKCQKVQIGHITSPVSSISSDWPSSAYSSVEGHKWMHSSSRIASSNSLLHWVLMANLGRHGHAHPLRVPYVVNFPDRPPIQTTQLSHKLVSASLSLGSACGVRGTGIEDMGSPMPIIPTSVANSSHLPHQQPNIQNKSPSGTPPPSRRKWRTFLQHNYNSPRKTVLTIGVLVGSVIITQIPLSAVLLTNLEENSQLFYFCYSVLFSLSSVTNPILYGFLNRSIRIQLWKTLRVRSKANNKRNMRSHSSFIAARNFRSRKDSISSGDGGFSPNNSRRQFRNDKDVMGSVNEMDATCNNSSQSNKTVVNTIGSSTEPNTDINIQNLHDKITEKASAETSTHGYDSSKSNDGSKNHPPEENQEIATISSTLVALNDHGESSNLDPIQVELDLQATFPRKTSQDSGADMAFSEDDEEEEVQDRKRSMKMNQCYSKPTGPDDTSMTLALTLAPTQDFHYQSQSHLDVSGRRVETEDEQDEVEPNLLLSLHLQNLHSQLGDESEVNNGNLDLDLLEAILVCREINMLRFYDDGDDEDEEYDSIDV